MQTMPTVVPTEEGPPLDQEILAENAELGLDGLNDLINLYLDQADQTMADLRRCIGEGAAGQVNQLAHRLAGASAVCGANAMIRPLRSLEDLGRKQDLSGADELLEDAERRLELCRRLLAEYLNETKCGD
jgi:HPt (histidine-containing phosphotransfer) domain-containing protein